MIFLTDDTLTVPAEKYSQFTRNESLCVLVGLHRFGPFPAEEAIFYARRSLRSSQPLLSMQRFAQINQHCSFKTSVTDFIAS